MEDAAKKVPRTRASSCSATGRSSEKTRAAKARCARGKNSRSAVVSGADPRGEALLFRKGVLGCCGFNGVEEASLTVASVPPGRATSSASSTAKTQKLNRDDGSVWKLKPYTRRGRDAHREACEAARWRARARFCRRRPGTACGSRYRRRGHWHDPPPCSRHRRQGARAMGCSVRRGAARAPSHENRTAAWRTSHGRAAGGQIALRSGRAPAEHSSAASAAAAAAGRGGLARRSASAASAAAARRAAAAARLASARARARRAPPPPPLRARAPCAPVSEAAAAGESTGVKGSHAPSLSRAAHCATHSQRARARAASRPPARAGAR